MVNGASLMVLALLAVSTSRDTLRTGKTSHLSRDQPHLYSYRSAPRIKPGIPAFLAESGDFFEFLCTQLPALQRATLVGFGGPFDS